MSQSFFMNKNQSTIFAPPTTGENYVLLQGYGHEIGKGRNSYQKLPPMGTCYGKPSTLHKYGTGQLIHGWKYSKDSTEPRRAVDFKRMNTKCIKECCKDTNVFKNLCKNHPIMSPGSNSVAKYCDRINSYSMDCSAGPYCDEHWQGFGKGSDFGTSTMKNLMQDDYGRQFNYSLGKEKIEKKLMHKAILDYERDLVKGSRTTNSQVLLKKYRNRCEQLKTEENQPKFYKSKLFPQPTKSSIDNKINPLLRSRTRVAKEERFS